MRFRLLLGVALSATLLAGCSQPQAAQPTPERPFQVTPVPATTGPVPGFNPPSGAYPAPGAEGAYPAPGAEGSSSDAYPAPSLDPTAQAAQGRTQSALTNLKFAQDIAKEQFSSDAQLYAILPSQVMIANLGNPPVLLGWFYKFKAEGSPREFIVQINDGEVTGSLETEVINPPSPLEQAIPLDTVTVDSDQVFAQLEQRASQLGVSGDLRLFDLELVNLQGSPGPIWNVFEPTTGRWLFALNATNGEEASNPRG
jgi:hypothetical protein